ncbi:MAG: DNA cytosine methyltransferase [Mesorhizobium sp.]
MRSVELFAGCGGLALGIARAGFKHDLIVEYDRDSVATLNENKNRKVKHVCDWEIEHADSRDLDYRELGDVALLSGGPPCQPFSIGGKHLGPRDPRNMWPEAVRVIREIRPKAFILENVRGLFRPDFAQYLDYITKQLTYPDISPRGDESWIEHLARLSAHAGRRKNGGEYRVISRSINAADYGAPQKRHRAIFIGLATDFGDDWAFPEPTHSQNALAWSKHVDLSYWKRHGVRRISEPSSVSEAQALRRVNALDKEPKELPWLTVRDAICDLPSPSRHEKVSGHWQHPGAKAYRNHTGSALDEPAKALKAGDHGVPGGENMLANRSGQVRYFTVREMARLQGFPDDFVFSGSWKAATRQLGNAVPTMVGEYIGKAVLKIMRRRSS